MKLSRVLEFALNRPYKGQMTPTRVFDLWEVICSCLFLPERSSLKTEMKFTRAMKVVDPFVARGRRE